VPSAPLCLTDRYGTTMPMRMRTGPEPVVRASSADPIVLLAGVPGGALTAGSESAR
jgi:hypothetical protein